MPRPPPLQNNVGGAGKRCGETLTKFYAEIKNQETYLSVFLVLSNIQMAPVKYILVTFFVP